MQFVQLTTQIVQFSLGNKAFLNIFSFFLLPFLWSLTEYKIYSYWTLSNHSQRPLRSIWINNDNIYLQHSKAICVCFINISTWMYEVSMLTLGWHLLWWICTFFLSFLFHQDLKRWRKTKASVPTAGWSLYLVEPGQSLSRSTQQRQFYLRANHSPTEHLAWVRLARHGICICLHCRTLRDQVLNRA